MGLANWLTIVRILLIPVFVTCLVYNRTVLALVTFVVAGVTDMMDGYIARTRGTKTRLGAFLDPLADKVLLDGIYVALAMGAWLPAWLVALVIGRDLLIVCGVALIRRRDAVFRPRPLLIGKVNTFAQILLAACALAYVGGWLDLAFAVECLVVVVALTTLLSGAGYAVQAVRALALERAT